LGKKNISRIPWAELWLGTNPNGPSRIIETEAGEKSLLLSQLISRDPEDFLGTEMAQKDGDMPFILKILAVAKPLSIQVHPDKEQAREGFEREEKEGILIAAPNRNYRDPKQKDEILCAITPFASLCGFRKKAEILELLGILLSIADGELKNGLESLIAALKKDDNKKAFLEELYCMEGKALSALGALIGTARGQVEKDHYKNEWELCSYLSTLFPNDPCIIAPLFLNIIELAPGEAMCIPAGTLHSHINGLGIELASNSDNVLRGGLTAKHRDYREFLKITDFLEFKPEIMKAPAASLSWFTYPTEVFSFSVMHGDGKPIPYLEPESSILIVIQGTATVKRDKEEITLTKGESVFIPQGKNEGLVFSGIFTAYAAAKKESSFNPAL
jgi:mannose-6-phosphate isomerase